MTREQFERIVSRSETLIREQPEKYKKSINRFAIFGYIAYSLALLFALSLFAFAVWGLATGYIEFGGVRLVIFAGFISILMLMSMWVKFEAPKGVELTREDAPSLFEELDRIRAEQDTAEIHQVLLTGSPNAMACSASKFLIFGERLYVVIGVPLLMSLKREELISVLAHELAHHSKAHVQDGNRAYRLVQMWQGLASRLGQAGSLFTRPMASFVNWYTRRLSAISMVLVRQHEFEADKAASESTSVEAAAGGLIRISMADVHRFAPYDQAYWDRAKSEQEPPKDYFTEMIQAPDVKPDDRTQTLTRLLKKETVYEDSHPSLRERVEALGIPANPHASDEVEAILERVSPLEATCWEELVTGSRQQMLDSLMGRILEEIGPAWKHKHEEIQHGIRAFERLKEVDPRQVSAKEAVEYLGAFVAAHSRSEGKKLAIELASIHSGSPEILASAGNYMLEDGDRDGFQFVQKAAELNPEYKYLLHELSAEYHSLVGDSKAARNESLKAQALGEDWQRSFNQLSQLKPEDIQTPMVVSDHLRSDLLKMGAELPDVLEVHAIHNQSAKNEAITAHVILLIARPRGMIHSNDTFAAKQTAKALELLGAHNGLVISTVMDKSKIGKTFLGAPEGCVYRRDS